MALHTCQIQQYDFHHCEQQFEKQCGKRRVCTPYINGWHCFFFVSSDSTLSRFQNLYKLLQPRRVTDEGVSGAYTTST